MKQWYTTTYLSGVMGLTVQGVRKKSITENWKKRKRAKGKGFEYHLKSLPVITQIYLESLEKSQKKNIQDEPKKPDLFKVLLSIPSSIRQILCKKICSTKGIKK